MKLSFELERTLPALRRFARASSSDPDQADDCVEAAILSLLNHLDLLDFATPEAFQLHLYRLVEKALDECAQLSFEKKAWRSLILTRVEGLSVRETASVLGVDVAVVQQYLSSASASPILPFKTNKSG